MSSITINIEGPLTTRWSINGNGSYESGHTESLANGTYTISFSDEPSFGITPEDLIIELATEPVIETVYYLAWSTHNIHFTDVNDWVTPDAFDVTMTGCVPLEFTKDYKHTFNITIIGPTEARYSVNGSGSYSNGENIELVYAETYTISFTEIAGLTKPNDIILSTPTGSYTTTVAYKQSIKVNIYPNTAIYTINGSGTYSSGEIYLVDYTPTYTLSFIDITDLIKPSNIVLTNLSGIYEATVYYKRTIKIYITPNDATYTVNGTGPYNSGDLVEVNFTTPQTIVFQSIIGLGRPDDIVLNSVGHYETIVEYSVIKRFLVRSNSRYYSFNNLTLLWTDITDSLSTEEPLPEEYDTYGMSRFEDFAEYMRELPDATNTQVFYYIGRQPEITPKIQLSNVKQRPTIITSDNLFLTDIVSINSITLTATNENNSKIYIIITPNDGQEYYTYKNNAWVGVARTVSSIINEGMSINDFNAVNEKFNDILNDRNKKLRFLFVFEHDNTIDTLNVDNLTYLVNLNGKYQYVDRPTTYTMEFVSNDSIQIKLLETGTFKINY